jgi:prepilin-type N-terminal cleavage/methylation domain-containing protein
MRTTKRTGWRHRPSFTLIELLVVIAIIATLLALSAGAYFRFIGTQQDRNSKTQVDKIHALLQKQWAAVIREGDKETIPDGVLALAGNDPHRARVIYTKLKLRQAFPMSFNEALDPNGLSPLLNYQKYLSSSGITYDPKNTTNASTQPYESAACLLMALQRKIGGGVEAEDLGSTATKEFTLANGKPIKALVDGYGNPLAFCRWPTGSTQLNPNGAFDGANNDPGDPEGTLTVATWLNNTTLRNQFQTLCHAVPNRKNSLPQSFKLVPIVASPGSDGKLGLDLKTFARQSADADDNVYSTTP